MLEARKLYLCPLKEHLNPVPIHELAACTLASSTKPCVSTSKWRFLPFTFLPPSYPRCSPPTPVLLTDRLSTIPAPGWGSRPTGSVRGLGWLPVYESHR